MHDAISQELRGLEPGNHPEHPALFPPGEVGLEPNEVVGPAMGVLGPELDHGPRAPTGSGIVEPDGLHGAKAQRVAPGSRDLLHRLAGTEEVPLLEVSGVDPLGSEQLVDEGVVLLTRQGAVEIVAAPLRSVSRLREDDAAVYALGVNDWRGRIVEAQALGPEAPREIVEELIRTQGAGCYDAGTVGHSVDALSNELDEIRPLHALVHGVRERLPVHGERPSRRHGRLSGAAKKLAPHELELPFELAGRRLGLGGLERVRTN